MGDVEVSESGPMADFGYEPPSSFDLSSYSYRYQAGLNDTWETNGAGQGLTNHRYTTYTLSVTAYLT